VARASKRDERRSLFDNSYMAISDNSLTGELPANIGDMAQLMYAASSNVYPEWCQRQSHGVVAVVCFVA
jgi:hypothetical protein